MSIKLVLLIFGIFLISVHRSHGRWTGTLDRTKSIDSSLGQSANTEKHAWIRKSLAKIGQFTSQLGSRSRNTKLEAFAEKFCGFLKQLIPIITTVCRFKSYGFCKPPELSLNTPNISEIIERKY